MFEFISHNIFRFAHVFNDNFRKVNGSKDNNTTGIFNVQTYFIPSNSSSKVHRFDAPITYHFTFMLVHPKDSTLLTIFNYVRCFMILAGFPATIELAGTSFVTTEFAPITALFPIFIPPIMHAPA